ncbi:Dol-P-Man:Man(7)GlcNAc(2)-PP-Dol alpha-1,6-mannosyltransferase [Savitreella phatthalungensis]
MISRSALIVFAIAAGLHLHYAPFTKVEESFNMQAVHDVTTLGVRPEALSLYDHVEFPGSVPRTFIGALILGMVHKIMLFGRTPTGLELQLHARAALGIINVVALARFAYAVRRRHGRLAGTMYILLQSTQFHLMYYASRMLPNMLAMPLTTCAFAELLLPSGNPYQAIALLTFATIVFRAELLLLLAPVIGSYLLDEPSLARMSYTILIGAFASLLAILVSLTVDTYFWRAATLPELAGFMFNAVQGKSRQWGVSPWWQYGLDIIRLLLNPMAILGVLGSLGGRSRPPYLMACVIFVGLYSLQPHKEWRFIVYIVPMLTAGAANCLSSLCRYRHQIGRACTILVASSIAASALISAGMLRISSLNYPGGTAVTSLPREGRTHLDVKTCMTGATRFLQNGAVWDKSEEEAKLASPEFWRSFDYIVTETPSLLRNGTEWKVITTVFGYSGLDLAKLQARMSPQLYILKRIVHEKHRICGDEQECINQRDADRYKRHMPAESFT